MIIFKLILVGFKQNLKSECSKKYFFEGKTFFFNKYILKKFGQVRGSFEPLGLAIAPPLDKCELCLLQIIHLVMKNTFRLFNLFTIWSTTSTNDRFEHWDRIIPQACRTPYIFNRQHSKTWSVDSSPSSQHYIQHLTKCSS